MSKKAEHVVMNMAANARLDCLHCGASYSPALPCEVEVLLGMAHGFEKRHANCELGPNGKACHYCMQFGHDAKDCKRLKVTSPYDWLNGPDTGISSKTIWYVMMGNAEGMRGPSYPHDPDDFGRCHRLLRLFPKWRERIAEVAEKHPTWAGLVREWKTLEMLYEEEEPSGRAPKLYALMQRLIKESRI